MATAPIVLSRVEARRVAIHAQLLSTDRPAGLAEVVARLGFLQIEATSYVAPSAYLQVWSRLGSTFQPSDLDDAVERAELFELEMRLRPMNQLPVVAAMMGAWPGPEPLLEWQIGVRDWVGANEACRRDILHRMELDGPLAARDIPDTCFVPWKSTGWTNDQNVMRMLGFMQQRGEVATAGRDERGRLFDLAERVHPDVEPLDLTAAQRIRNEELLHSLGIARPQRQVHPVEAFDLRETGVAARVEGVRGTWRLDPSYLGLPFAGRTAVLSPLDRLVFDRKRAFDLFEFDYQLEMYKPAAKRRWGYWALPVLYGDRLVAKIDARTDLAAGLLRVEAIHWDLAPTRAHLAAVHDDLHALAQWLDVQLHLEGRHDPDVE